MKKMKHTLLTIFCVVLSASFNAQTEKTVETSKENPNTEKATLPKPYHPEENANEKIAELIEISKESGKNIILQAGGNWCIWCRRFEAFRLNDSEISKMIDENYLYYHLNFSPDSKNEEVFARYGNPGDKFGYPVFIVLNSEGDLVHIQDSAVLEDGGKGYNKEKVMAFLEQWASR